MGKVTYRFMQGIKREVHKEERQNRFYEYNNQAHDISTPIDALSQFNEFSNDIYDAISITESTEPIQSDFDDSIYENSTDSENTFESISRFEDSLYESSPNKRTIEIERKNTDEFIQYNIDFESKVSAKEARTSIESRLPFIVDKADFKSFSDQKTSKRNKKSAVIRETDSIFKPLNKMRKSGVISEYNVSIPERIGFIEVTKTPQLDRHFNSDFKPTRAKSKTKKLDKITGILNDRFIITKKKGINKKKIGYLPVKLSEIQTIESFDNITNEEIISKNASEQAYYDRLYTQKKLLEHEQERDQAGAVQRYVEIIEDKGISRFIYIIALFIIICFIINTLLHSSLANDWSRDGLNLIKTEEQTIETETNIAISINTTPIMKKGKLNINLSSEKVEGMTYKIEIIDKESQEIIYQSNEQLESGVSISEIEIDKSKLSKSMKRVYFNNTDENIYREAIVRCETYKNNKLLGEIEQLIQIKIKPKNRNKKYSSHE